jgi:hypothetical protein
VKTFNVSAIACANRWAPVNAIETGVHGHWTSRPHIHLDYAGVDVDRWASRSYRECKAGMGPVLATKEHAMKQYLLSIYQPDGPPPAPEKLGKVMQDVNAMVEDAKAAGVWVFNGGLHPPDTATVVRTRNGGVVTTDGPFTEGKEHLGGFLIVKVPDLDAALGWARRFAAAVTLPGSDGLPIEVRPFRGDLAH